VPPNAPDLDAERDAWLQAGLLEKILFCVVSREGTGFQREKLAFGSDGM
jgi:hypothetical protein